VGRLPVPARVRFGEVLAALGAVVLLVALLALHWYGEPLRTGWTAIPTLRWFVLVTVALGVLLAITQATSTGPGLPVSLDLIGTLVAGLTTILLAIRLATTGASLQVGAYVGVVAAAATAVGALRALGAEQGWSPDSRPIELVKLSSVGPR
jgi:hypothetical protein